MITLTVITISKLHCCSFSELCFYPVLKSETNVNKTLRTDFHHRCVTAGMLLNHRSNDKQKILQICFCFWQVEDFDEFLFRIENIGEF
jgi:hypothetical protein